ncbi:MAG: exosortase F system-associated protein [Flavobacteriales bacterium]|nr:MAG: exosortase F system-associated protein [Flavobacteriales bacterium]
MKKTNVLLILLGILGLIGVRFLEDRIFYDPFIRYFQDSDAQTSFPVFDSMKIILHYLFRFGLNLIFSLVVIQGFFGNKKWTKQAGILIILFFIITFPIYLYCIYSEFSWGELFTFYMRRFVIQPLILLLIIPIFYYRKQTNR